MKKLLLSLGTLVAIAAPISAVVACSSDTSYTQSDLDVISKINSSDTNKKLELLWQNKIIQKLYSGADIDEHLTTSADAAETGQKDFSDDFVKAFKFFIAQNLSTKDGTQYLSNILLQIKSNAAWDDTFVVDAAKLLATPIFTTASAEVDARVKTFTTDLIDKFFFTKHDNGKTGDEKRTFDPAILGFKSNILRMMITDKYMKSTRDEWKEANSISYFDVDDNIKEFTKGDTPNFPLIIETLKLKSAIEYNVLADESKSNSLISFTTKDKHSYTDAIAAISGAGDLVSKATEATKEKQLPEELKIFDKQAPVTIGYEGLISLPSGTDGLDFSKLALKNTDSNAVKRTGFIQDGKLITSDSLEKDKIKYLTGGKTVDVKYVRALTPIYNKGTNQLEFESKAGSTIDVDQLIYSLFQKEGSSLYSDAINYFTNSPDYGIFVEIKGKELFDRIWDGGMKYVKEVE